MDFMKYAYFKNEITEFEKNKSYGIININKEVELCHK